MTYEEIMSLEIGDTFVDLDPDVRFYGILVDIEDGGFARRFRIRWRREDSLLADTNAGIWYTEWLLSDRYQLA